MVLVCSALRAITHLLVSEMNCTRHLILPDIMTAFHLDYVATIARLAGYEVTCQNFPHEYSQVLSQKFVAGEPIDIIAMTVRRLTFQSFVVS